MSRPKNFDVQGHRGARGLRPENTLAAFAYAMEIGVTTLELDTGISADGVLVVCHDSAINPSLCLNAQGDRLSPDRHLLLRELTVTEIQAFDCGSLNPEPTRFPNQQAVPGAKIPTLQQVFDLARSQQPDIRYNIESKVNPLYPNDTASPQEFAEKLVALVEDNFLIDQTTIQSFDWRVLREVKRLCPTLQTSALVQHSQSLSTVKRRSLEASPFLAGFDFHDFQENLAALLQATEFVDIYSPNFETLLPESSFFLQAVGEFQEAGFAVIPWTVNSPVAMQRLIQSEVDGLITDFPEVLLKLLDRISDQTISDQTIEIQEHNNVNDWASLT